MNLLFILGQRTLPGSRALQSAAVINLNYRALLGDAHLIPALLDVFKNTILKLTLPSCFEPNASDNALLGRIQLMLNPLPKNPDPIWQHILKHRVFAFRYALGLNARFVKVGLTLLHMSALSLFLMDGLNTPQHPDIRAISLLAWGHTLLASTMFLTALLIATGT